MSGYHLPDLKVTSPARKPLPDPPNDCTRMEG